VTDGWVGTRAGASGQVSLLIRAVMNQFALLIRTLLTFGIALLVRTVLLLIRTVLLPIRTVVTPSFL
jgi:hypothetical protein